MKKQTKKKKIRSFCPIAKTLLSSPNSRRRSILLQRIRDEAHRFAITYHKALKKKQDFTSALETVPGLGAKTSRGVLKHFGSIEAARQARVGAAY